MGIDEYEHFRLNEEGIDIALLDRSFMWTKDGPGVKMMSNLINATHIVLMHIHPDQNQRLIDVAKQVEIEFPSVTVFESLMESKEFEIF